MDIEEEARWAEQAGISLADIEDEWQDDGSDDDDESPGQLPLDAIGVDELIVFHDDDLVAGQLHPDAVAERESALMLLPMRVRLEALVAATTLVHTWCDLMADHEKCLGHLVLVHGERPEAHPHEVLVDRHAILHAGRAQHGT